MKVYYFKNKPSLSLELMEWIMQHLPIQQHQPIVFPSGPGWKNLVGVVFENEERDELIVTQFILTYSDQIIRTENNL